MKLAIPVSFYHSNEAVYSLNNLFNGMEMNAMVLFVYLVNEITKSQGLKARKHVGC